MKIEADYIMHPPGAECDAVLDQAGRDDDGAEMFAYFEYRLLEKNYGSSLIESLTSNGMNVRV